MIVQITGNVSFPITLDPTVWIFDDRRIVLVEAFQHNQLKKTTKKDVIRKTAERLNRAYHEKVRPPVNKNMSITEREQVLKKSYVMPIKEFIDHVEIKDSAKSATLKTKTKDVDITLKQLSNSLLQFSVKGKPLIDDGPVHLFFGDGSNKHSPIKGIKQIIIK